jgi:hypothetical protein
VLAIVLRLIESFTSEISKRLLDRVLGPKTDVCRELFRLYVVLEELLQQATTSYQVFEHYVLNFDVLKNDPKYKLAMRQESRELVELLKRYEIHLKKVFLKLKLLDEADLSIKLAEIPESSYTLFKNYFVEDLAPRFIADGTGANYVLRITVNKTRHSLVDVNKLGHISLDLKHLFDNGHLVYEVIDFSNTQYVKQVLQNCSLDLLKLKEVMESLGGLIRNNCNLQELL